METVQRTGPLDVVDAKIGVSSDGNIGLQYWHSMGRLHECGAERNQDPMDHRMMLVETRGEGATCSKRYRQGKTWWTIRVRIHRLQPEQEAVSNNLKDSLDRVLRLTTDQAKLYFGRYMVAGGQGGITI